MTARRVVVDLDRGWDLLEDHDPEGAGEAARRVLRTEPRNVEGHVLLGAAALDLGKPEEALARFQEALEIDPEDPDALLYAADTLAGSLDDPEAALPLCERAAAVAPDDEHRLDADLLRIESLLGLERRDEAAQRVRDLPEPPYPGEGLELRAAHCAFEAGDIDRAETLAQGALRRDDGVADTHHLLGLCAEERGDAAAMTRHFLRVRELDLDEPPPSWGMRADEFERIAERALRDLPEDIRRRLVNVPVIASDYPAVEIVAEGSDPRMMGFFSGVPFPEQSHVGGPPPHLDCIFLYQRNIERYSRSREELVDEIKKTLLHETGHFFALDEDDLEAIGLG
jgi:predicted Zn-dependent protease with MMP-like domain